MKYLIQSLLFILIVLAGCKSDGSQDREVQKLLDRQAEVKERQEESVDRIRQIKDSLKHEKKSLLEQRDLKDRQVQQMAQNQQALVDQLNSEEQTRVASQKQKLQEQITAYEDSIKNLKATLTSLGTDIDSLEQSMKFYGIQEENAEEVMQTGISEIDDRIAKLEESKDEYAERAGIIRKRISIFDKKIEAYEMERSLYVDEKDRLLRSDASDETLAPYFDRISRLDSVLEEQRNDKELLKAELAQVNGWISDTDEMIAGLESRIRNQYNRTEIVESYIKSEKQRLENELASLRASRENLISEQDLISKERSRIERDIASLDRKMELVRNREMSQILELQAEIQKSDASLTEEQIRNMTSEGTTGGEVLSMGDNEELNDLILLSEELDSLKSSIAEEKQEILRTRMELAERRAEVAKKRAAFGRAAGMLILILVIGGLAIATLFYFLGRRARTAQ
jgi:chromosome segregation ATPase